MERFRRWFREEVIQSEGPPVRRPPGPSREDRYAEDTASEPDETSAPATGGQDIPMTNDATAATEDDQIPSLLTQLQGITSMSGAEFERYMASVFEALGYDATLVGGAGDQGVDLVLLKDNEIVAVQCKNHGQPVGNRPVQEVYAGARHHGVDQAWVVAPAGFTKGALDLARSTGVVLYDRLAIEDLVRQANSRRVVTAELEAFDRGSYQTFLNLYSAMLDRLDRYRDVRAWYSPEISQSPEVSEQHERTRNRLYGYIGALLQDLDSLERRNLRWRTEGLTARRYRLDVRQQKIEQQAREQGILLKLTNVQNVGRNILA